MPSTQSIAQGGNAVIAPSAGADTLIASPQTALEWYADLMSSNGKSSQATAFQTEEDVSLKAWGAVVQGYSSIMSQIQGSVSQKAEANSKDIFAVRTVDGGALVMGEITMTVELNRPPTAKDTIALSQEYSVFTGGNVKVSQSATISYSEMVALWVPSKSGAGAKITPLAASQIPSGASIK
jgi:hypothetical protein